MKALIVVNAYIENKSQIMQANRITEELRNEGVEVVIERNFDLSRISGGEAEGYGADFCVFLDKDRVAARLLEKSGMRLFNTAAAIEVCDDKMLTSIALSGSGFKLPDCVYAPLCYNPRAAVDVSFLNRVAERLSLPLVAKTNYGSLGAGVTLIRSFGELNAYEKEHMLQPHFYQRFIDCGGGADTRVIVIGGKCLCAMRRSNPNDFRSNIELGGKGERAEICAPLATLCEGVAAALSLDYCGVDVLQGKDGGLYVCEVNSNAFFAAAEAVCKVNVAAAYVRHMLGSIK